MTSFVVQGWCPGALRPMMSGDGLVVRIRPRMSRLSVDQAKGLAKAARTHGNGLIDLTNRANLQLRGVRPESHLALLDDLAALGLIDADEAVERHRNIIVCPYGLDDRLERHYDAIAEVLADPEFANLPSKFGVALDITSGAGCLQSVSADIHIEGSTNTWLVRPEGFTTGRPVVAPSDVAKAMRDLIRWFLPRGVRDGRGRMAALAGQDLPPNFDYPMVTHDHDPYQSDPFFCMIGLEFGQMTAETLEALAVAPLHVTPWRGFILVRDQWRIPDLPGLIRTPNDPRLSFSDPRVNVSACTGAPGCPQALRPTRDLARRLAPQVPKGQHLHVSGCAKGCAHPAPADLTLTATPQGFTLIRNGRAADPGTPFQDRLT